MQKYIHFILIETLTFVDLILGVAFMMKIHRILTVNNCTVSTIIESQKAWQQEHKHCKTEYHAYTRTHTFIFRTFSRNVLFVILTHYY